MTEARTPERRLSRPALRALAWIAGGLAFASPFAALTASPKPATAADGPRPRRVIIVRTITRRIVVHPAPETPAVRYVSVGGGTASAASSSTPSGDTNASVAVAAPAPTSTGGS